jgi:pimeloyl-ACP methyl ester carboxylesterase
MREVFAAEPRADPQRMRLALLPGAYQSPEDFVRAGFAAAVASRRLAVDLSFIDIELDVLTDRTAIARLREEVVLPARAHGYTQVWLGGISLGGYVALDYASRAAAFSHAEIDGLCLLAPYLGNRMVIAEIARAGGVAAWEPGTLAESDEERRIWRFIKQRGPSSPDVYLGYGRDDRFAPAQALLGSALPARNVDVVPGGHEWPTWQRLWENFLDSGWLCSGP